jgi:hypothetical protein
LLNSEKYTVEIITAICSVPLIANMMLLAHHECDAGIPAAAGDVSNDSCRLFDARANNNFTACASTATAPRPFLQELEYQEEHQLQ